MRSLLHFDSSYKTSVFNESSFLPVQVDYRIGIYSNMLFINVFFVFLAVNSNEVLLQTNLGPYLSKTYVRKNMPQIRSSLRYLF